MKYSASFTKIVASFAVVLVVGCAAQKWKAAREADTIEAYETFLQNHPDDENAYYAKLYLEWKRTRAEDTVEAYERFLKKYNASSSSKNTSMKIGGRMISPAEEYEIAEEARLLLQWRKTQSEDTHSSYESFLKKYPYTILWTLFRF